MPTASPPAPPVPHAFIEPASVCKTCARVKAPDGRIKAGPPGDWCTTACVGYHAAPRPGLCWPGEDYDDVLFGDDVERLNGEPPHHSAHERDAHDERDEICGACNGSGEGRFDGTSCHECA